MVDLIGFDVMNADIVKSKISLLSFGQDADHKHLAKLVARRTFSDNSTVELWNTIDVSDLATVKTFVVYSQSEFIYEVDFLSRHDIVNPSSVNQSYYASWGFCQGHCLYVTNIPMFRQSMLTADALVAIPIYRFDFFADDMQSALEDGVLMPHVLEKVLGFPVTGYSFKKYDWNDETICFEFSVAEAAKKMV